MADEPILMMPAVHQNVEQPAPVIDHAAPRLATPEEIHAADRLFAEQEKEAQLVSGLMGLYTGSLVLCDLAAEHLARNGEDEEEAKRKLAAESLRVEKGSE